ncbi:DNA mismatch repair protein MutS [Terriglobus roseus DSM 18391]|uniref:DNA mismatch repair protein MutS n=1 Tax=Terriglobus roseus (strain DSM 18391 / NRRL B-41598 / KBS 63) TaxID=926566 RepID=I3ZGW8_TERRK|nr:DNA mismatch repair protein MutS [Terriglobus roseus]AFL88486.1 DNA mismatch repair protein MutS [Terriglobus roseus DSM 18391]AFL88827.1 DNA mismatch repair protein MutS [Terriglobus roseus DSM 18391]
MSAEKITTETPRKSQAETLASDKLSPMMRQFAAAKAAHPDSLLFFRMGDFYELFYDDAVVASRELQLTLTARDRERQQPMCGVPYHAAEGYLQRLLRKGYRIAICEQMEDPKLAKGIVKREVTRVFTPGTALDPSAGAGENTFLASLAVANDRKSAGVALLDLSTGEFRTTEFRGADAVSAATEEVARNRPREVLLPAGLHLGGSQPELDGSEAGDDMLSSVRTRTPVEDWVFTADYALPLLQNHYRAHSLEGFGLAGRTSAAIAAGALLHYLRATKHEELEHLDVPRFYERSTCLELDAVSVRNLELIEPLFSGESQQTTLCYAVDACRTPMGKRMLRAVLLRPSIDVVEIAARHDAVGEAARSLASRERLRRALEQVLDLERLLARLALDSAGPREVVALARTLAALPPVQEALADLNQGRWGVLREHFDTLEDVCARIQATLVDEPPLKLGEGDAIQVGVDAELDELRGLSRSGREAIAAIEERERTRTGIGSLKVRFNSVFGYYLEITKSNLANVPSDYERKQTLVNAERFTTPELKEYERKILTAQERVGEIERRIFAALRREVLGSAARMREASRRLAEIDLLANFAHIAALRGWSRPEILADTTVFEFAEARHPVVELRLEESGAGRFIPNSGFLDGAQGPSLALITGPNMGGKSTYLRMAALLAILAQSGSFVPAVAMKLGLVDRIFTRIGASDNVARGRSTFMVEMTETAAILNSATPKSLVLLDEMGRGTATYDGLSLAWAAVEHLHDRVGARTLFATHYHELTLLEEKLARLKNLRVACRETPQGIVFLHQVESGAADRSYGIEVAKLAGLPRDVIARARAVLKMHEKAESASVAAAGQAAQIAAPPMQMTIFTPLSQRVVDRVRELDVDRMTPMEALQLLAELKREIAE